MRRETCQIQRKASLLNPETPQYRRIVSTDKARLLAMEQSELRSWNRDEPEGDAAGLNLAGLFTSGLLGQRPSRGVRWVFDHNPKCGGTEFAVLCQRRLYDEDHLWVRWPNSWLTILVGRADRACIVHGHGARYARKLLPHHDWATATTLREPRLATISAYQQWVRAHAGAERSPSFEEWMDPRYRGQIEQGDLNRQTRWFGLDRHPDSSRRQGALQGPQVLREQLARAKEQLDQCQLIGTPETVHMIFRKMIRTAQVRVLPRRGFALPANSSPASSAGLLASLSHAALAKLDALTAADRELYAHACNHPGFT